MNDKEKTKEQLIRELEEIRQRINKLEASEDEHRHAGEYIEKEIAATAAVINDMLSGEMDDLETGKNILEVCLDLTDSKYGMIGRINERGKFDTTIYNSRTLQDCEFPDTMTWELSTEMTVRGIWGWPMLHGRPLICNNLEGHPDRVGFPEGHVPLSCFLGVPLMRNNEAFGMIAVADKPGGYTEADKAILTRLASVICVSHQHRLATMAAKKELDLLVKERTKELQEEITERLLSEFLLAESEERFRIASGITSDVVYERDIETGIATFFGDIDSHLGYEPGGFPRTMEGWREHVHPEDLSWIDKMSLSQLKPGVPYSVEYRMRKQDGTYMTWLDRVVMIEKEGKPVKFIGAATDITESKRAERVLRESEERYRTLTDTAGDAGLGIIVLQDSEDQEATIVFSNKRLCNMLGYNEEELRGKSAWDILALENLTTVQERYRERRKGKDIIKRYEALGIRIDGTQIPTEVHIAITNYHGKPATVAYVKDITEQKRIEEEHEKAQRLESLGILAGGIAHDFNNYLTSILGNIGLTRNYIESGSIVDNQLREAEEAVTQAKGLTTQLLTFAKGGTPIKDTISIGELIQDATEFSLRGSNVKPEFFMQEDLWPVDVDTSQMNQVISNLVINAAEAMRGGGTLEIKTENYTIEKEGTIPLRKGNYLKLYFTDHGSGIPEENLHRVFDPYFSTKEGGSGLGLAVVYSIIKAHGGHIEVMSQVGAGTTFRIFLPASKKRVPKPKPDKKAQQLTLLKKSKILVMDDNKSIRRMLEIALGQVYDVGLAADGAEAIKLYAEAMKNGQPFDVVIMDLTIPGGIGGQEAIGDLLEIDPDAMVIVSSGYSSNTIMSDFKKYGFSGVLLKPYNIDELLATIESLPKRRKSVGQPAR